MAIQYLSETESLEILTSRLPKVQQDEIQSLKHRRIEQGFKDRKFIVYNYDKRKVNILANLHVLDFQADEEEGCSFDLSWGDKGDNLIIGHTPVKLWDFPIYMSVPCHPRLMFSLAVEGNKVSQSLAFPVMIKTQSRMSLKEGGVTYIESLKTFNETFPQFKE